MTEPNTTPGAGGELLDADPAPFLRITGTWPAVEGRVETVQLEMNLGDGDELAGGGDLGAAKSWFIDLCTCVIAAMRRSPAADAIALASTGVPGLAERITHVEGCDGSCGQQLPLIATGPQGDPAGGV